MDDSLKSEKIQVERKQFFFDLKENPRGRFLRITEDVKGRRDTIILPIAGLEDFRAVLDKMIEFNNNGNGNGHHGSDHAADGEKK